MIDQIGGRKALAAFVVLLIGGGVTAAKGDIPAGLLTLLQVVFGAFVAGNVGEHIAGALKRPEGAPDSPEAPAAQPESSEVLAAIHNLDGALANARFDTTTELEQIKQAVAATQQGVSVILQMAGAAPRN